MAEIKLKTTTVFEKTFQEYQSRKHRIVILEGGTGSSKSVSLAQLFATIMVNEKNVQLTIARKTFPALRATSMKDFFNVLKEMGIYKEEWHNKSEHIFKYPPTGSEVDFVSVDEPMKIRSRRRNYLWMNEANEFSLEDYRQLSMRTNRQLFLDYNPSSQFSWIYDELETRKDCIIIPSSYKDNPFLPEELVREIESYKDKDQNYWRVYGLGLRGYTEVLIYTHWKFCDDLPENPEKIMYGLDFGFNNPTALVKIILKDKIYYWQEMIYQSGLTNSDLIKKLGELNISKIDPIYADNAEPQRIAELQRAGFNVLPAYKVDVKNGIDKIKSRGFYITKDSVNLLKELKFYSWKEREGRILEEPIKQSDHLLDAGRYAISTNEKGVPGGMYLLMMEDMKNIPQKDLQQQNQESYNKSLQYFLGRYRNGNGISRLG